MPFIIFMLRGSIPVITEEGTYYSPITRYFASKVDAITFGNRCASFSLTECVLE